MGAQEELEVVARRRPGETAKGRWRLESLPGCGKRGRFGLEGYAANAVEHPGVPRVLDEDVSDDGSPVLVMDLHLGEYLDARCKRLGDSQ